MKPTVSIILLIILISTLCSCIASEDKVLNSLGKYKSHEFYTEGAFQDYTDYAKYYYDSVDYYLFLTEKDLKFLKIMSNCFRCSSIEELEFRLGVLGI
jgi:hypothetical protein